MPSYLKTPLFLQLPFRLLSMFAHLDAIIFSHFNSNQDHGQGKGDQGKSRPYDSSGTLESDVHMALVDFISHGYK